MESRLLLNAGIAASIVGHMLFLTLGVLMAEVRPFGERPTQAIAVDIVPAPEEKPAQGKPPPEPDPMPPALPDPPKAAAAAETTPSTPQAAPQPAAQQAPAPQPPPQQQAAAQPPAPPKPAPQPKPERRAHVASMPPAPASAAAPAASTPQPAPMSSALAERQSVATVAPDVTAKYDVMLGLPGPASDGFDARAVQAANVARVDVEAFRRKLRSCSVMPAGVSASDNVRIVLRAFFRPDGHLATDPMLIEASASAKGPLLMQSAIHALEACQPYVMLPADKYDQWKTLDLSFTPHDFDGG